MRVDLKITKAQKGFLRDESRLAVYRGGLGSGKSWALTLKALLLALKGDVVLYLLPTYPMIKDVAMPTVKDHLSKMGLTPRIASQPPEVEFSNGGKILFRSAEIEDRLRGINAHHLLIDEAGYIAENVFVIATARARIEPKDGKSLIRIVGTPNGSENWASKLDCPTYTQSTMDSPFLSDEYKQDLLKRYSAYGEEFVRQELYGEVVDRSSAESFISGRLVQSAVDAAAVIETSEPVVIGADISASLSGDLSVAVVRRGKEILEVSDWRIKNSVDLAEALGEMCDRYGAAQIIIDAFGVGNGVISALERMGLQTTITPHFGWNPSDDPNYANLRAHSYGLLRKWLEEGGKLPEHKELKEQIPWVRWQLNGKGQILLEPKENLKRRHGASPDYADALAYACTENIVQKANLDPYGSYSGW